ncbi:hypothetical protein ABKN59_007186 [Abortiporus biennis]
MKCNETGFTCENVEAICRVGKSTKHRVLGYIGEKGIGFKASFAVADVVSVTSSCYAFKFDKREELGMIAPIWTGEAIESGWTVFRLQLTPQIDSHLLVTYLHDVKPSLLLFLRKLRKLEITCDGETTTFSRRDLKDNITCLDRTDGCTKESFYYLVFRHKLEISTTEEKRSHLKESEVVLAFPITSAKVPVIGNQMVHAFLPLRSYGFSFLIQADFLTAASREDILADSRWNQQLLTGVVDAFLRTIPVFQLTHSLELSWLRYIPSGIADSFMKSVENTPSPRLRDMEIVKCIDGCYRRPCTVIIPGLPFCMSDGHPLVNSCAPLYYISPHYHDNYDLPHLRRLGVSDMSFTHLINWLKSQSSTFFKEQTVEWHEKLCTTLLTAPWHIHGTSIKTLPIVPLEDGEWYSADSSGIFFRADLDTIPLGLGIRFASKLDHQSSQQALLIKAGLKKATPQALISHMLEVHQDSSLGLNPLSIVVDHAHFLFQNGCYIPHYTDISPFWVFCSDGSLRRASDVFMNDVNKQVPLSTILTDEPFLHLFYYKKESECRNQGAWLSWLHDTLKVKTFPGPWTDIPRLFKKFLSSVGHNQYLYTLKDYWVDLLPHLNSRRRLDETYFLNGSLQRYPGLPFLSLPNESVDWDFLQELGVSIKVDAMFFLKQLRRIRAETNSPDESEVRDIYRQLQSRYDDDQEVASTIRSAFREEDIILSIISSSLDRKKVYQWVKWDQVVWSGPPSMRSKYPLRTCYRDMEGFFVKSLGMDSARADILIEELEEIAKEWNFREYEDAKKHIVAILKDLSDALEDQLQSPPKWISTLAHLAIFPCHSPKSGKTLLELGSFYVPDAGGKLAQIFREDVALLDLTEMEIRRVGPFLSCPALKSEVKFLSDKVTRRDEFSTATEVPNPALSNIYTSRLPYIVRLIATERARSHDMKPYLRLQYIRVNEVDEIKRFFTLENFEHSLTEKITVETSGDQIIVRSSNSTDARGFDETDFAAKLASHLTLHPTGLFITLTTPLDTIERTLKTLGIHLLQRSDFDEEPEETESTWLAESQTNKGVVRRVASSHNQPRRSGRAIQNEKIGDTVNASDSATSAFEKLIADGVSNIRQAAREFSLNNIVHNVDLKSGTNPQLRINKSSGSVVSGTSGLRVDDYIRPAYSDDDDNTAIQEAISKLKTMQLNSTSGDHYVITSQLSQSISYTASKSNGLQDNGIEIESSLRLMIGVLGEYLTYEYLKSAQLPGFNEDTWTNTLRGSIPGFQPFDDISRADITYDDVNGYLTEVIFGKDKKDQWDGFWPTYLLEVKTTVSSHDTPFHMSARQMQIAAETTVRDLNKPPQEVFVLVRISGMNLQDPKNHTMKMYPDLHHSLYKNEMCVASDVEVAILT